MAGSLRQISIKHPYLSTLKGRSENPAEIVPLDSRYAPGNTSFQDEMNSHHFVVTDIGRRFSILFNFTKEGPVR